MKVLPKHSAICCRSPPVEHTQTCRTDDADDLTCLGPRTLRVPGLDRRETLLDFRIGGSASRGDEVDFATIDIVTKEPLSAAEARAVATMKRLADAFVAIATP